jgi:hypothetical protein
MEAGDQKELVQKVSTGRWSEGQPQGSYRPENRGPVSGIQSREGEVDGRKFTVSSGFVEVSSESGVKAKARVLMVDFRDKDPDPSEKNQVYVGCSGFPGISGSMRESVVAGNLSEPKVTNDLDFLMIKAAKENHGVAILPEMHRLPKGTGSASFDWDGETVLLAAEKFSEAAAPGKGLDFRNNVSHVSLSGYSNGAGEAGAAAVSLCKQYPEKSGFGPDTIDVRFYSLIGIVPVENVAAAFGQEVWGLAMVEVADRLYKAQSDPLHPPADGTSPPEHFDTSIPGNDKKLLAEVVRFIWKEPEGWNRFLREVKASAGAEDGGNLQIGIDLVKKLLRDPGGLPEHMRKYGTELDMSELDSRVAVELVLPANDRMMWNGLHRKMSDLKDVDPSAFSFTDLAGIFRIDPGWEGWSNLFPHAKSLKVASVGGGLLDPAGTHTGPPLSADRSAYLKPNFSKTEYPRQRPHSEPSLPDADTYTTGIQDFQEA